MFQTDKEMYIKNIFFYLSNSLVFFIADINDLYKKNVNK